MSDAMLWGLIGSRGYAANACAPALAEADGAALVAVLGRDRERAGELLDQHGTGSGDGVATDDLDELLTAPGLEAVWIASPTYLHHDQARAAIAAGKHVLVEKPLAFTAAEAWALVEAAEAAGVVLATGYQARYVPGHRTMRELIAGGALGAVSVARTYYGVHRAGPPSDWRQQRATARWGALADIGTHHLDLLRMLLGEVDRAVGIAAVQQSYETDSAAAAALRFASGAVASLTVSVAAAEEQTLVEIVGADASLVARGTSPRGGGSVTLHRPGHEPEDVTGAQPLAFVAQVETVTRVARGADEPYATGIDGARNIEILEQLG